MTSTARLDQINDAIRDLADALGVGCDADTVDDITHAVATYLGVPVPKPPAAPEPGARTVTVTWTETATYTHTFAVPQDFDLEDALENAHDEDGPLIQLIVNEADYLIDLTELGERDVTHVVADGTEHHID